MLNSADEAVVEAKAVDGPTPDVAIPEVKPQPRDAVFGPSLPPKLAIEEAPKPKKRPSLIGRALRFSFRTVLAVACLGGLAWAGKTYYPSGYAFLGSLKPHLTTDVRASAASAASDDTAETVKEMAEEIRALKASVDALGGAQGQSAQVNGTANADDRETLQAQLNTVQTTTSAAIADLAGRVNKLEADSNAKLSQIGEQLDGIEHRIPAQKAATVASAAPPPHKRVAHVHDAFDPSRDPTAPGAPRPLGSAITARPIGPYYAH